jgi:hypothetical protein
MYEPLPDSDKPDAFGLTRADFERFVIEVWPENWEAFSLFRDMQTQWRMGAMGATGLDYGVLYRKLDRMQLDADEYDQLEADIQTMEFEALSAMSTKPD